MKRHWLIFALFFVVSTASWNHANAGIVDSLVKREAVNAVPDAPAFNALGNQPSNILRPSDIRTIAVDIGPFIQNGKFAIPKDFALEISPGALIYRDRRINIEDYRANKVFLAYNTTFSIGTSLDSNNGFSKLAIGWRTTFINRADKFLSDEHRATIDAILMNASVAFGPEWTKYKSNHSTEFKDTGVMLSGKVDKVLLKALTIDDALASVDSNLAKQFMNGTVNLANTQELVDRADKAFERSHWNALRVDAAAAFVAIAEDSLGKNIKPDKVHAWFTAALPLHTNGQIVLGIHGNSGFESKKDSFGQALHNPWQIAGSARIYAGVSRYKFFTEVQLGYLQGEHIKSLPSNLLDIGAELSIANIAWINIYGGFKDMAIKAEGKSIAKGFIRFDLKLALPDYIKFRN